MAAQGNKAIAQTARRRGERGQSVRPRRVAEPKGLTKVHALQAGHLRGNETAARATSWWSLLRQRVNFEFPAYVYIIEQPEGHIAIDTGMKGRPRLSPGLVRRGLGGRSSLRPGNVRLPKRAAETSRRVQRFTAEVPTVLLPAHDTDAPRRLAAMEPIEL